MRRTILAICGLFLASTLLGCGGTNIPSQPSGATPGPPPGNNDAFKPKAKL